MVQIIERINNSKVISTYLKKLFLDLLCVFVYITKRFCSI